MKLFEAIPLSIFVFYIRYMDLDTVEDWNRAFLISGVVAFLATLFLITQKINLSRIFLGVNLYLISAAIAIVSEQFWLNEIYAELHASGMLIWVVMVGLGSMLLSPQGFIGVDSPDKQNINKCSLLLLFTAICAFGLSFTFRGNIILSEAIPFILIFAMQHILTRKMTSMKKGLV